MEYNENNTPAVNGMKRHDVFELEMGLCGIRGVLGAGVCKV